MISYYAVALEYERDQNMKVKRSTLARKEARIAYAIMIPFFVYIAFWNLIPLISGILMGFTEYNALNPPRWVGLRNYRDFFDPVNGYLTLLVRQVWMGAIALALNTVISFAIGLALNVSMRGRGFFRVSVYVPAVAAVSVTTAVFVSLLDPVSGGVNRFLLSIGQQAIPWSHSQFWMVFWIVTFFVWRNLGVASIIWLGGLQGIDPSLHEAAQVDGATFVQRIRYIVIPGLRFVASYIILTGIIGVMQMFDVVMFISQGNPFGQTDVLMYRIFRLGAVNFNLGMAGASSTILGFITLIFVGIYLKGMLSKEAKDKI